jgi:hypothetical protein
LSLKYGVINSPLSLYTFDVKRVEKPLEEGLLPMLILSAVRGRRNKFFEKITQ